jgi:hypothetical protein
MSWLVRTTYRSAAAERQIKIKTPETRLSPSRAPSCEAPAKPQSGKELRSNQVSADSRWLLGAAGPENRASHSALRAASATHRPVATACGAPN